jgi:hypothetical protein
MKQTTTQTYTFDKDDIVALVKNNLIPIHPNTRKIQVSFVIESEPGYDGPGIPPQVLTKVVATYTE